VVYNKMIAYTDVSGEDRGWEYCAMYDYRLLNVILMCMDINLH